MQAPHLYEEIKALFASNGVTEEQEAETRAILAKDPESYFPAGNGQPPGDTPPPVPPPEPAPQPEDPSKNKLALLDDAIALAQAVNALGGQQYHVDRTAEGKFQPWPNGAGPEPGERVWPV